jgi:hypothetical protein
MGCAVAAPMMILDRHQMIHDVKTTDKSVFVYPGRLITTALLVFPTKSRWNYPRNNRGNKSEQMGYKANKKRTAGSKSIPYFLFKNPMFKFVVLQESKHKQTKTRGMV